VKFGLSNIAVMYTLFFLGRRRVFSIVVLKALFVLVTRGFIAGILSFFGGILSITVMAVLMLIYRERISYLVLSIFGAIFHNIGQFTVILIIYTNLFILSYLPVLLISGLVAGIITSTLLKFILPVLKKINYK